MTEDYSHRKKEEACTKEQLKNRQVLIILCTRNPMTSGAI